MAVSANRLELLQIADAVAREKAIEREIVIAAMADAIQKAARSRYGQETNIEVNIDPKTGCPVVAVNTASPMYVLTEGGEKLRVTPFNFAVTDTQVVAPDYDLLVPISDVKGGEVQTFSGWKTGLMIAGVTALAVGFFVGIQLTADEERELGQ